MSFKSPSAASLVSSIAAVAILGTMLVPLLPRPANAPEYAVNLKQAGLSLLAYANDWDDNLPQSLPTNADGTYPKGSLHQVPAGWRPNTSDRVRDRDSMFWANTVRLYYQDSRLLELPGGPLSGPVGAASVPGLVPQKVGWAINGLLHCYPLVEIGSPGHSPLLWSGFGNRNWYGYGIANPVLDCPNPGPCRMRLNGSPQPTGGGGGYMMGTANLDVDHGTMPFLSVDLSMRRLAARALSNEGLSNNALTPVAAYSNQGELLTYWACGANGYSYPCFFLPFDRSLPAPGGRSEIGLASSRPVALP